MTNLWEQVLAVLQTKIPKVAFGTWLKDSKSISYEDGILTVSVRNIYARDWLDSRARVMCESILLNLTGAPATIRFVVDSKSESEELEEQDESGTRGGFTAEAVDATSYQNEVRPEKVVVLPGYALRLLEHGDLTPKQMSLWLGFRQAVYAQRKREEGVVRNIPHWEVCRFAMMSRASYFREIRGRSDFAGGLVERLDSGTMGDANRYRVHMTPRLTRRDCAVIERLLAAEVAQASTREEGIRRAVDALNNLAERNPADYLEGETATTDGNWPRSVSEIVRDVIGLEGDLPHDLADAAERLTDRVLGAYGNVVITHHFLTKVVPTLGFSHAQAWAIIMLRDRAWYDYDTRTQRDFAIVPGGLRTLAKWVGATRRSLELWVNTPEFSAFVQCMDVGDPLKAGEVLWVRHDEPLHLNSEKMRLESEKVRLSLRKNETLESEILRLLERKNETLLKTSIKPLLNPYKPLESPPAAQSKNGKTASDGWGEKFPDRGSDAYWNFDVLCRNNSVQPGSRTALLKKFAPDRIKQLSEGFVSWLLYAAAAGYPVNDPVALAVRRLLDEAHAGAGGDFDRLAQLPPWQLRALLTGGQASPKYTLEGEIFAWRLGGLSPQGRTALLLMLFGEGDEEGQVAAYRGNPALLGA